MISPRFYVLSWNYNFPGGKLWHFLSIATCLDITLFTLFGWCKWNLAHGLKNPSFEGITKTQDPPQFPPHLSSDRCENVMHYIICPCMLAAMNILLKLDTHQINGLCTLMEKKFIIERFKISQPISHTPLLKLELSQAQKLPWPNVSIMHKN
jgi:hypothetical protein